MNRPALRLVVDNQQVEWVYKKLRATDAALLDEWYRTLSEASREEIRWLVKRRAMQHLAGAAAQPDASDPQGLPRAKSQ
jgi:hypothetical protein